MHHPSWILPTAEKCPESRELVAADPIVAAAQGGVTWRHAFRAGVRAAMGPTAEAHTHLEAHRMHVDLLPSKVAMMVNEAVLEHVEATRLGTIPPGHRFGLPLAIDMAGNCPAKQTPSTLVTLDAAWIEVPADKSGSIGVVVEHALAGIAPEQASLELLIGGTAWAIANDLERMRVGVCVHAMGKQPTYLWSPMLEDHHMQGYLARMRSALTCERVAVVGPHCDRCPVRRLCPSWQFPVLTQAHEALRSLQRGGPGLTPENYPRTRQVVQAMREAVQVAEGQLRTFERDGRTA